MPLSGQSRQDANGIGPVPGLADDLLPQYDHRVRRQDHAIATGRGFSDQRLNGQRLVTGNEHRYLGYRQARRPGFGRLLYQDVEGHFRPFQ